ncbi:MAG: Hsp20/alpha crystallin family protein [Desulfobacteraceae bacterium]|nr:Hsp20/alpha crystallin family protein [Desulfobacteraceae bacterium]
MMTRSLFNFPVGNWRHPFAEMDRLSRRMDWLTNAMLGNRGLHWFPARVFPAVNITEDKERYYIRAELPGMKAEDVELQVTGRNLSITGERRIQPEDENARYYRREREGGKFSRVIGLPGDIDADRVEAGMTSGVLTVAIGKSEASKPKQITVH